MFSNFVQTSNLPLSTIRFDAFNAATNENIDLTSKQLDYE